MGTVFFSDVHADAGAVAALASTIRHPSFYESFGKIDTIVNLGDILHRGDQPREAIEIISGLKKDFNLISILGNHDHAFLNDVPVSGSDETSACRHEALRNSPLLSIFDHMPLEWVQDGILCVHGGPLNLGTHVLRLKCWQRLSHHAGDSFTGYHYTAPMAFAELAGRGLSHMVCGHQHTNVCCRKTPTCILEYPLEFSPCFPESGQKGMPELETVVVPLDLPALFRIGSCHGPEPEFAYADYKAFSFIRIVKREE